MKRYSVYFKVMMGLSLLLFVCGIISAVFELGDAPAIAWVWSFIMGYAGIASPDHEKYVYDIDWSDYEEFQERSVKFYTYDEFVSLVNKHGYDKVMASVH